METPTPIPSPPPRQRAPAVNPSSRRKVLVVDDNRDAALSLRDVLQLAGHDVVLAHDGAAAIHAATADIPDVILCDIGLPGVSGYDVARALRFVPPFARVLFVAVTGYGSDDDASRAREAGFDFHFTKPVDPEVILALLASWTSHGVL